MQRARREEAGLTINTIVVPEPVLRRLAGLETVFRPRSVAVIGASRERGTIGAEIFHNLIENGFTGPAYPINPKADSIHSVRAYRSVSEIPEPVDLAIIVVPAAHVLDILDECGRRGVRAAVIISAGFKETGAEGEARERALRACAAQYGMRIVGPNCLGVLNTEENVRLDATFAPVYPPKGRVAFSTQSGALGVAILEYATELNIGISQFISVGNKADVSGNDLLEFWEDDPGTEVILLYLESFGNPRRFTQIARRVGRKKPIVAVKSGRTTAGIRAASSHTGALAGADAAVDALCEQSGVIRTDTIEELFDVAMALANQPVPRGNRVGIVTNAGGPGIMATDACENNGLTLPLLDPRTVQALRQFLPPEASTRNPVDMIASAAPQSFERALDLVLRDPNIDAVLAIYVPPLATHPLDVAQAIVRGAASASQAAVARGMPAKPVLSCFMGAHGMVSGLRLLHEGHIPSYVFPESAALALARIVRYARWRETPEGNVVTVPDVEPDRSARVIRAARARRAGPGGAWLNPAEIAELLRAYGIRMPASLTASTAEGAVQIAKELGFPVVLKVASDTITHKSDVGGVAVDLRTAEDVDAAFRKIEQSIAGHGLSGEWNGVTVQEMVREGVEAIIGVTLDPSFGPLIMFGIGGIYVEILKDVAFRIHPLTDRDAREMVRSVRGYPLLEGFRGSPPGDVAALEEILLRVSQLVGDHPEILEMDLNPLKVLAPGRGCVAVDARIRVQT